MNKLQVRLLRRCNTLLKFLLTTDAIVKSERCFSKCRLLLCEMTTGPCSCSFPCLGPPLPYTLNAQIQSITDESRSSIRRKHQGPGQCTSLSRKASLMDDTQEDEVAHFLTRLPPMVPHCQASLDKAEALGAIISSVCLRFLSTVKG